uniref:Uncharacterized protein n=1 Tax=Salix viminalis TaxID=40686 RepID=A0A6N2M4S5_SALVM
MVEISSSINHDHIAFLLYSNA